MRLLLSSSAVALLLAAQPALAQSTSAQSTTGPTSVDEVIVTGERATTATKTDTPLIRTPQAISVVDQTLFNDRGALTVQETLRYSAGATAEPFGLDTRGDAPVLRGFNSAQYQDGLNKILGFNLIPRTEVYTLERVEVLRGPSSMLYGQGSTGGVVNYISKKPTFERGGEIVGQVGSFDRYQGMLDYQTPLNEAGTLAARLVVVGRDAGTQTDHVDDDRIVVAPSISWRPDADTTLTLLGLYQDDHTASTQQFLPYVASLQNTFPRLPVDRFLGEPDYDRLDTDQKGVTLLANRRFGDRFEANANVRYVEASTEFREIYPNVYANPTNPFIDAANQVLPRSAYAIDSDSRVLTADINGVARFTTGPISHVVLAGVDILDFNSRTSSGFDATSPINAYNPVYGLPFTVPTLAALPDLDQTQVGIYLQDQLRWNALTVVAGVRRDRAEQQTSGSAKQVDEATSLRIGAIYDLGAALSPYVSYSESFLPLAGQDFFGVAYRPQEGEQWEVGVKWRPFAGALVTLAAYDLSETNRLTNDPENVLNTVQTGEISGQGVELEASWTRPRDWSVTLAASHAETIVENSSADFEEGRQASDTPRTLASAWAVKTLPLSNGMDLRLGGGVRYVGPSESIGANIVLRTPSYTLADALVAIDWKDWSFSVNATNLFDEQYFAPCRFFGDCFTGQGRNLVASVGYRF
ncbi:TonB-dependent siderophore receptor [Brevundimonas sp.]|uniref:TonB-dependent siderophore receptor n=1 Tax=Brevundimonas sp. TaxID=1871086 RepID=UPI003D0CD88B